MRTIIEIDPEVDFDVRRAVYFRQMRYGLFVSALLVDEAPFAHISTSDPYGPPGERDGVDSLCQKLSSKLLRMDLMSKPSGLVHASLALVAVCGAKENLEHTASTI